MQRERQKQRNQKREEYADCQMPEGENFNGCKRQNQTEKNEKKTKFYEKFVAKFG